MGSTWTRLKVSEHVHMQCSMPFAEASKNGYKLNDKFAKDLGPRYPGMTAASGKTLQHRERPWILALALRF